MKGGRRGGWERGREEVEREGGRRGGWVRGREWGYVGRGAEGGRSFKGAVVFEVGMSISLPAE